MSILCVSIVVMEALHKGSAPFVLIKHILLLHYQLTVKSPMEKVLSVDSIPGLRFSMNQLVQL